MSSSPTTLSPAAVRVDDCGDSALSATVTGANPDRHWEVIHALADALEASALPGIRDLVPTYRTMLVEFDCTVTGHDELRAAVLDAAQDIIGAPARPRESRLFVVPVVYGGVRGPDLELVAEVMGISPAEVISIHGAGELTMRCFAASGSAMLDGPPLPRPVPRLATPRTAVPPGSVTLAGRQALICPMRVPSGWQIIGQTPARVLDPRWESLTVYRAGDRIRFRPIQADEWDAHEGVTLEPVDG